MPSEIQLHCPRGLSYGPVVLTVETVPDVQFTFCTYCLYGVLTSTTAESKQLLYFILEFLKMTGKSHQHCSQRVYIELPIQSI